MKPIKVELTTDFDTAIEQVTAALKAEGFGVLTDIDITTTFKTKLDVDFRPYRILGACNPALAHRALNVTSDVGTLLPCNVTVSQIDDATVEVAIVDPIAMLDVVDNADLADVAQDARDRLDRVATALKGYA